MASAAAIGGIASLAGSVIGAHAAKKAAHQQAAAQQAAIATQEKYLSPYANAGQNALGGLEQFVNQGANFADTQAFKDITNSAKASGQFGSGNRLTALTDYYATNFRPQRLNELSTLPFLGSRAAGDLASGIGGLQQNIGNIQGQGTLGQASNFTRGLGALGSIDFSGLLKQYNLNSSVGNLLNQPGMF